MPCCRRKSAEAAAAAAELKRKQEEERRQKYLALKVGNDLRKFVVSLRNPKVRRVSPKANDLKIWFHPWNLVALQRRHDYQRRKSVEELQKMKERRSSEIYMSFREAREQIEKQAKETSKKIETEWEEQGQ